MRRASHWRQRLVALGLLGLPLLTFPIVGLPMGEWLGLPAAYLYLFGVWLALVFFAAVLTEGRGG